MKDIAGQRFGRLLVVEQAGLDCRSQALWRCHCDCGKEKIVPGWNLRGGLTQSCGCICKEFYDNVLGPKSYRHGLRRTKEYQVWAGMKGRCYNRKNRKYKDYGARGITVCDEWKEDFEAFYRDMGPRPNYKYPKGLSLFSLDRIDNDGPYCKENCHWATAIEQANNRRVPRLREANVAV